MNLTEAKYALQEARNRKIPASKNTSNIYKSQAQSDYEKKKEAEHKAVHDEIKRVALQQTLI